MAKKKINELNKAMKLLLDAGHTIALDNSEDYSECIIGLVKRGDKYLSFDFDNASFNELQSVDHFLFDNWDHRLIIGNDILGDIEKEIENLIIQDFNNKWDIRYNPDIKIFEAGCENIREKEMLKLFKALAKHFEYDLVE